MSGFVGANIYIPIYFPRLPFLNTYLSFNLNLGHFSLGTLVTYLGLAVALYLALQVGMGSDQYTGYERKTVGDTLGSNSPSTLVEKLVSNIGLSLYS